MHTIDYFEQDPAKICFKEWDFVCDDRPLVRSEYPTMVSFCLNREAARKREAWAKERNIQRKVVLLADVVDEFAGFDVGNLADDPAQEQQIARMVATAKDELPIVQQYINFVGKYGPLGLGVKIDGVMIDESKADREGIVEVMSEVQNIRLILRNLALISAYGNVPVTPPTKPPDDDDEQPPEEYLKWENAQIAHGAVVNCFTNKLKRIKMGMIKDVWGAREDDIKKGRFVFRQQLYCHRLIDAMYYYLYQVAATDSLGVGHCDSCGRYFEISNQKKDKHKCANCIAIARGARGRAKERANPYNKYRDSIKTRVSRLQSDGYSWRYDSTILDNWYNNVFLKNLKIARSNDGQCKFFDGWKQEQEKSFSSIKETAKWGAE